MSIFKNKDEDFEDEDEFEEEESGNRKFTKKFKDLKPENKKKRKEPPKPWGKKERLTILIVLVVTVVVSTILSFSNGFHLKFNKLNMNLPRFSLESLNIFKGETIIVDNKR